MYSIVKLKFTYRWTNQRKAFGKPLYSLAIIRSKLAAMMARVESVQSWLENITYQMNNMVCLRAYDHMTRANRLPVVV